jgi:hypothetical protein
VDGGRGARSCPLVLTLVDGPIFPGSTYQCSRAGEVSRCRCDGGGVRLDDGRARRPLGDCSGVAVLRQAWVGANREDGATLGRLESDNAAGTETGDA